MTKECKTARNAVLIPIAVLLGLVMFLSSCATTYCPYAAKNKRLKNTCAAYR